MKYYIYTVLLLLLTASCSDDVTEMGSMAGMETCLSSFCRRSSVG